MIQQPILKLIPQAMLPLRTENILLFSKDLGILHR